MAGDNAFLTRSLEQNKKEKVGVLISALNKKIKENVSFLARLRLL